MSGQWTSPQPNHRFTHPAFAVVLHLRLSVFCSCVIHRSTHQLISDRSDRSHSSPRHRVPLYLDILAENIVAPFLNNEPTASSTPCARRSSRPCTFQSRSWASSRFDRPDRRKWEWRAVVYTPGYGPPFNGLCCFSSANAVFSSSCWCCGDELYVVVGGVC